MKSILRLACLAALLPAPVWATEPVTLDVYRELVRYRAESVGVEDALDYDTRKFVSSFLEDPDSMYSELRSDPPMINEIWWYEFVDSLPIGAGDRSDVALGMLQWQGGFTKARPGIDIKVDRAAAAAYGKVNASSWEAAASALKAGVDSDIYRKAWDLNGRMTTIAAGQAVALQLLREEIRTHAPETYESRAIRPDVLSRYLAQRSPDGLDEDDENYLADILRAAVASRGFTIDANGRPQLPASYRVARVAAAYADAAGNFNADGYCLNNNVRPGQPTQWNAIEDGRPLCFIAATDRATHAWFRRHMRQEAAWVREAHAAPNWTARREAFWLNTVLLLIDLGGFVEFGDAGLIEEMRTEGSVAEKEAELAETRANQLTCRIR